LSQAITIHLAATSDVTQRQAEASKRDNLSRFRLHEGKRASANRPFGDREIAGTVSEGFVRSQLNRAAEEK
jgi:hypothetical protein